jgi:hypothetical protein
MGWNMSARKTHKFKRPFDDSGLPISNLSAERIEEIEKIALPRLQEAFEKLREEKLHLFKSSKK